MKCEWYKHVGMPIQHSVFNKKDNSLCILEGQGKNDDDHL